MIRTARQLKDLIRNLAKTKAADAQLLLRNYMMERFLERVSLSPYRNSFILKGGMLVAALVGLDARSTMDMDATIRGIDVDIQDMRSMIESIAAIPIDDGVTFVLKDAVGMMDEAEYPGVRLSLEALFDGVQTPLKIDISTGDVITPRAIEYRFPLMLENRWIAVLAYNLETVIAEKLETLIVRATLNTRMRDFYDLAILHQMYGDTLSSDTLSEALRATFHRREHDHMLTEAQATLTEVQNSPELQRLWAAYQKKFSYAASFSWSDVLHAVNMLFVQCRLS